MATQTLQNRPGRDSATAWLLQVQIRHVTASDLPALEWGGEFAHFRRVYADAYQRMVDGKSLLWVADLPGTGIIGQVFIQLTCDREELADGIRRAYLYSFRIQPTYRRAGLGTRVMQVVEADLVMRGFEFVTLNVAKTNTDALRLYYRHGYRIVAPEPGVWNYPDQYGVWHRVEEPAWRMEKKLID